MMSDTSFSSMLEYKAFKSVLTNIQKGFHSPLSWKYSNLVRRGSFLPKASNIPPSLINSQSLFLAALTRSTHLAACLLRLLLLDGCHPSGGAFSNSCLSGSRRSC